MGRENQSRGPVSTADLIGILLYILSWELTAALFAGRWLFGPGWFGPWREWVALGISVALSVYYAVRGRWEVLRFFLTAQYCGQLSRRQALVVVALVTFAGAFAAWLFI
jgi:hypothetical protein